MPDECESGQLFSFKTSHLNKISNTLCRMGGESPGGGAKNFRYLKALLDNKYLAMTT